MATKKQMIQNLNDLNISSAIADKNASVDGTPAILLRWNGLEHYYTGSDIYQVGDDPSDESRQQYQQWLQENFK